MRRSPWVTTLSRRLYIGQAVLRSWLQKPQRILFSDMEDRKAALIRSFRPSPHELHFQSFGNVSNFEDYDLVVPLNLPDLRILARQAHRVDSSRLPIPSLKSINVLDDKLAFHAAMQKSGFLDHLPALDDRSFPYVVKKRQDEWSRHTYVVATPEDECQRRDLLASEAYFVQQLIPGRHEYTTHLVVRGGQVVCELTVEFEFAEPISIKGKHPHRIRLCQGRGLSLFTEMLAQLNFEGICCVNYKIWRGRIYVFEINPRFGGTLAPYFIEFVRKLAYVS